MNAKNMTATLAFDPKSRIDGAFPHNAKNMGGEKETVRQDTLVSEYRGTLLPVVEARWYMGHSRSASTVYCSVWIGVPYTRNDGSGGLWDHASGHGSAGGYGYHKESAALEDALHSAGGRLSKEIAGVGDSAIREALLAVARAVGVRSKKTVIV